MTNEKRWNIYTCRKCGWQIITVDRDEGTTPMFLDCRSPDPNCGGLMISSGYPSLDHFLPGDRPMYEWYTPDEEEYKTLSPGMKEHIDMGGLALRKIDYGKA